MRLLVPIVFTTLLVAGAPALACSQPGHGPELVGYPKPGAVDVPTNAVLSFVSRAGTDGVPPERITLLSASGERVTVSTRTKFGNMEIVPSAPLSPNTQYELSVLWQPLQPGATEAWQRGWLSFRTGAGPWQGEPSPPTPSIEHWTLYSSANCDGKEREVRESCVSFGDDDLYLLGEWYVQGSAVRRLYGYGQGHDRECLPVQRRAPTGVLSAVSLICRTDGRIFDLRPDTFGRREDIGATCTLDGLERDGKWVRDLYDGEETALRHDPLASCSLAAPGAGSARECWPLLLLSGALARRRKRAPSLPPRGPRR